MQGAAQLGIRHSPLPPFTSAEKHTDMGGEGEGYYLLSTSYPIETCQRSQWGSECRKKRATSPCYWAFLPLR